VARAVRTCVALLVAVAGPATPSAAQAVYGSIAGTVSDSSGARAPGASLTITSLDRGTVDRAGSNASGYYCKDRLLPGRSRTCGVSTTRPEWSAPPWTTGQEDLDVFVG
jgi:hypothetical protein